MKLTIFLSLCFYPADKRCNFNFKLWEVETLKLDLLPKELKQILVAIWYKPLPQNIKALSPNFTFWEISNFLKALIFLHCYTVTFFVILDIWDIFLSASFLIVLFIKFWNFRAFINDTDLEIYGHKASTIG